MQNFGESEKKKKFLNMCSSSGRSNGLDVEVCTPALPIEEVRLISHNVLLGLYFYA